MNICITFIFKICNLIEKMLKTKILNFTKQKPIVITIYAGLVSFFTYTFIFGLRKSFTICTFSNVQFLQIDFKTWLVISQMLGYLIAKFVGIKYIAELNKKNRYKKIFFLIGIAWVSWFFFAIVPMPYNIVFLFLNGLPLGLLWGIIFSYIEGRIGTDFIGACLAVSFIFAAGFVKSVGSVLLNSFSISELWVPFTTGLVFIVPLIITIWGMEKIPPPTESDKLHRMERKPMSKLARKKFISQYLLGIIFIIIIYLFATIFRDIRDNYTPEIFKEMGFKDKPYIFTQTEIIVSLLMLGLMASMVFIKNNMLVFNLTIGIIFLGFLIAGISTYLYIHKYMYAIYWFIFVGLGLYMVYIPFNCIFFDRMIAAYKMVGNVGFLIYIADSFGYLGSIAVLISKSIFKLQINWLFFFTNSVQYLSVLGGLLTILCFLYFRKKINKNVNSTSKK